MCVYSFEEIPLLIRHDPQGSRLHTPLHVYICVYIYMYTYMYIHRYMYIHIYMYVYIYSFQEIPLLTRCDPQGRRLHTR